MNAKKNAFFSPSLFLYLVSLSHRRPFLPNSFSISFIQTLLDLYFFSKNYFFVVAPPMNLHCCFCYCTQQIAIECRSPMPIFDSIEESLLAVACNN
jgi:hypothetical protein